MSKALFVSLAVVNVFSACIVILGGQPVCTEAQDGVVSARGFLLENEAGEIAGALRVGGDGRPELVLMDEAGRKRIRLGLKGLPKKMNTYINDAYYKEESVRQFGSGSGGELTFMDAAEVSRVELGEFYEARGLKVRDVEGEVRIEALSAWFSGEPTMEFIGGPADDRRKCGLGSGSGGGWILIETVNLPAVRIVDKN